MPTDLPPSPTPAEISQLARYEIAEAAYRAACTRYAEDQSEANEAAANVALVDLLQAVSEKGEI